MVLLEDVFGRRLPHECDGCVRVRKKPTAEAAGFRNVRQRALTGAAAARSSAGRLAAAESAHGLVLRTMPPTLPGGVVPSPSARHPALEFRRSSSCSRVKSTEQIGDGRPRGTQGLSTRRSAAARFRPGRAPCSKTSWTDETGMRRPSRRWPRSRRRRPHREGRPSPSISTSFTDPSDSSAMVIRASSRSEPIMFGLALGHHEAAWIRARLARHRGLGLDDLGLVSISVSTACGRIRSPRGGLEALLDLLPGRLDALARSPRRPSPRRSRPLLDVSTSVSVSCIERAASPSGCCCVSARCGRERLDGFAWPHLVLAGRLGEGRRRGEQCGGGHGHEGFGFCMSRSSMTLIWLERRSIVEGCRNSSARFRCCPKGIQALTIGP